MSFKQLHFAERYYIEIELKNGTSQNKIAKKLKRSQSSISREVRRNKRQRGYKHQQAHRITRQRHKKKNKKAKLTEDIKRRISNDISLDWSPEQVAGRLKKEGGDQATP